MRQKLNNYPNNNFEIFTQWACINYEFLSENVNRLGNYAIFNIFLIIN